MLKAFISTSDAFKILVSHIFNTFVNDCDIQPKDDFLRLLITFKQADNFVDWEHNESLNFFERVISYQSLDLFRVN